MQTPSSAAVTPGLILTGGGARSAYQVGVLKAVCELLPRAAPCPFPVITGTSAGAVSAVVLAADAGHFRRAVSSLERVWRGFRVDQVFRADSASMLRSGLHWMLALITGGWLVPPPHSLFDNTPLWNLLRPRVDFKGIRRSLKIGALHAVAISATSYSAADSVAFYDSVSPVEPWRRAFRKGEHTKITLDHLMASLAIPFLFRPVRIGGQFFGDGAMRQTAPLSPAIHLGANRLLIIGVRTPHGQGTAPPVVEMPRIAPTFGQMFGFMLDTLFMDQVYADLERMHSVNDSVNAPAGLERRSQRVDSMVIVPSEDLSEIAHRHVRDLPRTLRILLRTIGANNSSSNQLLSYLLFEGAFTRELIALGHADGRRRAQELKDFLFSQKQRPQAEQRSETDTVGESRQDHAAR
jgi:NTE family protein